MEKIPPYLSDAQKEVYLQGIQAFRAARSVNECPYALETENYTLWQAGYGATRSLARREEIEQLDSSKDWLKEVCLLGTGSTVCRYLVVGGDGFECAKHDLGMALTIDRRVAAGTFNARGDNCKGLPPGTIIPSRSQP